MPQSHIILHTRVPITPYATQWVPSSNFICAVGAAAGATGKITVYSVQETTLQLEAQTTTDATIRCMSLGLSNNRVGHVATGNYHGHLQIWDIEHSEIPLSSYKAHGSIVNAISGVGENNASGYSPEIATGGKDGFVKVWDARECEKPVLSVNPSQNKAAQDIWCISFGDIKGHRVVAVGYANGDIRLFDVVASRYLWKTKVADGVCSLDFSNGEKEILMASTLDGLYSFDLSSGEMTPIAEKIGLTLWAVRHCPQMPSISAIAGGDGRLRFSQENTPGFIHDKAITNHPVISFDWNRDAKGLFVCASFDQSLRVGMIKGI